MKDSSWINKEQQLTLCLSLFRVSSPTKSIKVWMDEESFPPNSCGTNHHLGECASKGPELPGLTQSNTNTRKNSTQTRSIGRRRKASYGLVLQIVHPAHKAQGLALVAESLHFLNPESGISCWMIWTVQNAALHSLEVTS